MQQVVEWTRLLQAQRAIIVEKLVRAKANTKIARELTVDRSLDRTLARILRDLSKAEELLNKSADNLNKCRGLFLELSDGEVLMPKTESVHGNHATSTGDRGTVSQGTDGSTHHAGDLHASGTPASTTSTTVRGSTDNSSDTGIATGNAGQGQ
jgi:hypothetical protein